METIISLSSLFLALAYLSLHLGAALSRAGQALAAWMRQRSPAGRLEAAQGSTRAGAGAARALLAALPGLLAGVGLAWLGQGWLAGEWALLALTVLGLGLEELHEPRGRALIPQGAALVDAFRQATVETQSIWQALESAAQGLLGGEVRQAAQEASRRAHRGLPPERCLGPLRRLSPHLDEFVVNLKQGGWTFTPALDSALALLAQRMRRDWSQAGQQRRLFDRLQPFVRLGSAAVCGALLVVLWRSASSSLAALHGLASAAALIAAALAALGTVLALRLVFTQAWLRRGLGTAALVLACLLLVDNFANPAQARTLPPGATLTATAALLPSVTLTATPTRTPTPLLPSPAVPISPSPTLPLSPTPPFIPLSSSPTPPLSPPSTAAPSKTPPLPPTVTPPTLPGRMPTVTPPVLILNP